MYFSPCVIKQRWPVCIGLQDTANVEKKKWKVNESEKLMSFIRIHDKHSWTKCEHNLTA